MDTLLGDLPICLSFQEVWDWKLNGTHTGLETRIRSLETYLLLTQRQYQ